jgi:hypothetical protein
MSTNPPARSDFMDYRTNFVRRDAGRADVRGSMPASSQRVIAASRSCETAFTPPRKRNRRSSCVTWVKNSAPSLREIQEPAGPASA